MTAGTAAGTRIGPYVLQGLLGTGAMGEVHRAADTAHGGRPVALKLLPPEVAQDAERRARFEHESRVVAALTEPHVVDVHSYGEIDGRLYLDMQLLDGPDLAAHLITVGPLPPEHAVAVVEQVAAALDAAHAAGLVHHDVKPSNVLLHRPVPGQAPQVVLADFGIAGDPGGHGTVEYLAPERFAGRPGDRRVDVYALACLLHELLTGTRAYPGGEFAAQLHGHVRRPPPRPSTIRAGVPAAFDAVVARGMAKDPDARPATAGELAAEARTALRPARRGLGRRTLLVGAAAGVVTLGGGLGITAALRGSGRPAAPPARIVPDHALGIRSAQDNPFTLGAVGDRPVAIVLVDDHTLQAWDVLADRAVGPPLPGGIHGIAYQSTGLAVAEVDGRGVLCGTPGGAVLDNAPRPVTFTDLESGRERGRVQIAGAASLTCPPVTASPMCVVLDNEGGLTRIDLRTMVAGERKVVPPEPSLIGSVSAGVLDGTPCAVVTNAQQTAAYDATSFAQLAEWPVWAQGVGVLDGTPVAINGLDGAGLTVAAPGARPRVIDAPGSTYAVAAELEDALIAAVGFDSGEIALYDIAGGTRIASPLTGHQAKITELGVVAASGRPLLVSTAADNAIRVWDLAVRVRS
jgi:tRNA A-37 threonylcarbamoyl transferase component Bud32